MEQNLVDIININLSKNTGNITKAHYKCENDTHHYFSHKHEFIHNRYFKPMIEMCENCGSIVCQNCRKNDMKLCVKCTTEKKAHILHRLSGHGNPVIGCDHPINSMCNLCGNLLCFYYVKRRDEKYVHCLYNCDDYNAKVRKLK